MTLFRTLIGIMILSSSRGFAMPGALTLEGALNEGRQHSPQVQSALSVQRESSWKKFEAFGGFLPTLSVSANHYFTYQFQQLTLPGGTVFNLVFPLTSLSFDARLTVFDGFRNVFQYQAASLNGEAADKNASWVQFQTEQEIRTKFYEALASAQLATVADQNVRTLEDHIKKIHIRRSGGLATRYDVLRVEVQLDEAQSEKVSSDDAQAVAKQKLLETMGLDRDDRSLEGELPKPTLRNIQSLIDSEPNRYLNTRDDIVALARKVDAADRHQAAASAYWVPKVSAGYDYTYYNNVDTSLSTPFGSSYYLGAFLTWNIFDPSVNIAQHKEAAEQTRQAEIGLRTAQLKFRTDFENWRRQYIYNTRLYDVRVADVGKAQEEVRLADEGYRAGIRTTSEVLDAELDLYRARAGAVRAQLSAAEALINLELVVGRKLQ